MLARVTLPKQKLVDGATLRLLVVDGLIERIEVKRHRPARPIEAPYALVTT